MGKVIKLPHRGFPSLEQYLREHPEASPLHYESERLAFEELRLVEEKERKANATNT